MALKADRSLLEQDGIRRAVREAGYGHLLLSDEALARSLAATLAERPKRAPIWVFGYGSLVWSPMMDFAEKRIARLRGYHRGFYLWSKINRGTPQRPGLVLGLDRGGSCGGIAYRLHEKRFEGELSLLWRREMLLGTYMPRWVRLDTSGGPVRAIAFVVDRSKPGYTGRLTDHQIVSTALHACGHFGSCADYLMSTARSLEKHGIADRRLSRLADLLARQHSVP